MESDESHTYWESRLSKLADSTRVSYISHFRQFCEWAGKQPDDLIRERRDELGSDDPRIRHRKEDEVLDFLTYLREVRGLRPKTQRLRLSAIKSFFSNNYMPLDIPSNLTPSSRILSNRRAITKIELKKVLELTNVKWKALILTLRDTGFRISDVIRLQMRHVNNLQNDPPIPIRGIITEKDNSEPIAFLGSDSINALQEFLEFRERGTLVTK